MEFQVFFVLLLVSQLLILGKSSVYGRELRLPSEEHGYDDGSKVHPSKTLIGILSLPKAQTDHPDRSYIAASYVKFVESGGARAVPLLYNEPEDSLKKKFSVISGIVFTGGDANLDGGLYLETAKKLFSWAIEANDKGDYFPIYGVCLGLELLSVIVSGWNMLDACPAHKIASTVQFVDEAAKSKSVFKWIPNDVLEKMETETLVVQNHNWGVKPATYSSIKSLVEFFEVLAVSPDINGDMYISAMQGKNYPVTAVMFHPEKNAFEWNYDAIPHSSSAIQITQGIANYFISEAHKSSHSPTSREQEDELIINNYNPDYTGKNPLPVSFEEVYYLFLESVEISKGHLN
ncbi:hypothetical protein R1flu_023059 [Riccia fluitans]|uniref:folate gamma-glutamyl hydrolase n=1 Tax=Riccia fluitans TaxID=41844 RepID=A0ABD1XR36_9MARC